MHRTISLLLCVLVSLFIATEAFNVRNLLSARVETGATMCEKRFPPQATFLAILRTPTNQLGTTLQVYYDYQQHESRVDFSDETNHTSGVKICTDKQQYSLSYPPTTPLCKSSVVTQCAPPTDFADGSTPMGTLIINNQKVCAFQGAGNITFINWNPPMSNWTLYVLPDGTPLYLWSEIWEIEFIRFTKVKSFPPNLFDIPSLCKF